MKTTEGQKIPSVFRVSNCYPDYKPGCTDDINVLIDINY